MFLMQGVGGDILSFPFNHSDTNVCGIGHVVLSSECFQLLCDAIRTAWSPQ